VNPVVEEIEMVEMTSQTSAPKAKLKFPDFPPPPPPTGLRSQTRMAPMAQTVALAIVPGRNASPGMTLPRTNPSNVTLSGTSTMARSPSRLAP